MIPIRDENPSRTFPIVTVVLIALNVLAFLFELSLGPDLKPFLFTYALVPVRFLGGEGVPNQWSPLFVSMFLHGGIAHLGGNMLYLWIFGDNVEDRLGHLRYFIFYVVAGAAAALTHVVFDPGSELPMVGASGAIAGVLGAYFVTYPRARVLTYFPPIFFFHLPAVLVLGFWFVGQVFSGGVVGRSGGAQGGIAFMAHVGGFVAGVILMLIMRPRDKPRPRVVRAGDPHSPY